jgi:6,7-dimethyl-8-ribityllumazine synthase
MSRIEASMNAGGMRFAIVASRWNEFVTERLVEGALRAFRMHGGPEAEVVWVSGSWEIPVAALAAARSGTTAVVCIGCILQGATTHAQQLSNGVASAIAELTLRTGVPMTWGVLTCATQEEAIERAGMKMGNKGEEAALAAIEAASVRNKLLTDT